MLRQTKIHNIGAKVVGVDQFGNKYYEKLDVQFGKSILVSVLQLFPLLIWILSVF